MPALRALLVGLIAALLAVASIGAAAQDPAPGPGPVRVIELDGGIDPVSAAFVGRRLDAAADDGASAVVIRLDTPGGLVSSMRDIVTDMGASPVPVTVWIGPSGARAGSAGAYISAAADQLGMAPGTNIGSATPIGSGGQDLDRKVVNDSAAFIQALAEEHGRNGAAYRAMVVSALNLTAEQAVARNVADVIQPTVTDFVAWLDGQPGRAGPIHTAGAPVETDALPWYLRGLQVLTDPTLVFFLLLLGLGGLAFEVFHPGAILPGVAGGICLLLGLAGLTVLPFSWAGIALLLLGVGLLVAETQVGGFGALAAGGVVALALGGAFLFDSERSGPAAVPVGRHPGVRGRRRGLRRGGRAGAARAAPARDDGAGGARRRARHGARRRGARRRPRAGERGALARPRTGGRGDPGGAVGARRYSEHR